MQILASDYVIWIVFPLWTIVSDPKCILLVLSFLFPFPQNIHFTQCGIVEYCARQNLATFHVDLERINVYGLFLVWTHNKILKWDTISKCFFFLKKRREFSFQTSAFFHQLLILFQKWKNVCHNFETKNAFRVNFKI